MPYTIIDRRKNAKGKSSANRQKFIRRAKKQVKEAIKKQIREGEIGDLASEDQKKINIPTRGLGQPTFHHTQGGKRNIVQPGNREYVPGDKIPKPSGGSGQGNQSSDDGEGLDGFVFSLTHEEFMDLFFEDLELPDMVKKNLNTVDNMELQRAGFSTDGNPSRLNLLRTMHCSKMRRFGMNGKKKRKLRELEEQLALLDEHDPQRASLLEQIENLLARIKKTPFIDDFDLRYNRWERKPVPSAQAVMYCIMDVSGSMDEWKKEMSKSFFLLMYLFLLRQYKRVHIRYIRHHNVASLVDEEEFFHSRETGGTVVSTGLKLMLEDIKEHYPLEQWNIYGCQCSDGDNFFSDRDACLATISRILEIVQYFAYVEVKKGNYGKDEFLSEYGPIPDKPSDLWKMYEEVTATNSHFVMNIIDDSRRVYPVFRRLFQKERR